MDNFVYPDKVILKAFISIIQESSFTIKRYLPSTDEYWYEVIDDTIEYVKNLQSFEEQNDIYKVSANLLYKIAKRHEMGDGNKRSSVIVTYCFCLVNNHYIRNPQRLKDLAKSLAATKGRDNEDLIKRRAAEKLRNIIALVI